MPGAEAELDRWYDSVEVILRCAPDSRLVLAIVSGVLLPRYVQHPLTRLRRRRRDRQRISEFVQVIRQLLSDGGLLVHPRVSFAPPVTFAELGLTHAAGINSEIAWRARQLLLSHRSGPQSAPAVAGAGESRSAAALRLADGASRRGAVAAAPAGRPAAPGPT